MHLPVFLLRKGSGFMDVITLLLFYISGINLTGFALMGIDKYKAKKRAFRIPEATLFIIAAIGGSVGSLIGMYFFHHKTLHRKFTYGIPLILIIQIALAAAFFHAPFNISIL